ncbi:hypothetical protein [Pseudactinotalea sp. Z1732]|uniref:hypothetical protein n=1 Tax=Micrococcales TaxID=85006 RepID=UPI003C7E54BA
MSQEHGAIELTVTGSGHATIRLRGDLDCLVADQGHEVLMANACRLLVEVDASDMRFIDACGLTAVLRLVETSRSRPRLTDPPATLRFLLDVAQRWDLFEPMPR